MGYAALAWAHAWGATLWERAKEDRQGQGTVEYIGVVVMVTLLIAAVAAAARGWAGPIGDAMRKTLVDAVKKVSTGL